MSKAGRRIQKIALHLSEAQLRRIEDDVFISASDLSDDPTSLYFLGYYSREGIKLALKNYGIYHLFKKMGFEDIDVVLDTQDTFRHRLAIVNREPDGETLLLSESVLRRQKMTPEISDFAHLPGNAFEILYIEWLTLRNPRAAFSKDRPRLPGQEHPGLGASWLILELLSIVCKRLHLDGMINVPEFFHNAHIYSRQFKYIDPAAEGRRRAIARDLLSRYELAKVSWGIDLGCVTENQQLFKWFTIPQLYTENKELSDYFNSSDYQKRVAEQEQASRFQLDEDSLSKKQYWK